MTHKIITTTLAALVLAATASSAFAVQSSQVTCNDGTEVEVTDADAPGQALELCLAHGGVAESAKRPMFGFTTKRSHKIGLKR